MPQIPIEAIQRGLEVAGSGVPSDGSNVAATYQVCSEGAVNILDRVVFPKYPRGSFGGVVEDAYVAETGTEITLNDHELTPEELVWDLNHAVKAVPGAATSFAFPFSTTTPNSIRAFTYEYVMAAQTYEAGYGMYREYNIHADADDQGGTFSVNGVVVARKAAPVTKTSSLGKVANRQVMNLRQCLFYLDALGTAPGSNASTMKLKGFTWNLVTGWMGEAYAAGRAAKDFADGYYHGYALTGTFKVLCDAAAVTQIANMRAGTAKNFQVKWTGDSDRDVEFDMPAVFMGISAMGSERKDGLRLIEFSWDAGRSETSTAAAPAVTVVLSGETTVT